MIGKLQQDPHFVMVSSPVAGQCAAAQRDLDREKAKTLGVPIDGVFDTLAATLGTYYVNDFNKYGRTWQVLMSAEPAFRSRPEDMGGIYIRAPNGVRWCPLSALAQIRQTTGPETLERFNNLPSVKIIGAGAPGFPPVRPSPPWKRRRRSATPEFSYDWGGASSRRRNPAARPATPWPWAPSWSSSSLAAQYEALVPAAGRLARPALRHLRRPGGGLVTRHEQRRLFPDRSGHPPGPRRQECHPDRRIRHLQAPGGHERGGSGDRGCAPPLPAHPDDFAGLHPRRAAPRHLPWRRGRARQAVGTGVMGGMLAATFLAVFFVPSSTA